MKLLFAHDFPFAKDNEGNVYSGGGFPYKVWERYLSVFNTMHVAGRRRKIEGKDIKKMVLSSGENVSFIEVPNLGSPSSRYKNMKKASDILAAAIDQVDAVIARLPSEIGSLAVKLAKQKNKPWAVEVVSCPWDSYWNYGKLVGKLYAPIAMLKTKSIVSESSYALYVTREFLQSRYPSSGETESCSNVEINETGEDVLQRRLQKIENMTSPIKLGLIGSLSTEYKGFDTAIKALKTLKNLDIKLHLLGGGDSTKWKDLANSLSVGDKVVFEGRLPSGAPVHNWLDEMDIYIQPSRQEGLPRALIEAMSRGCPSLGSTAGGIPELLDSACLHQPNDFARLAKLIERAIEDKDWLTKQAQKNHLKSKEYTKTVLDNRRKEFWTKFLNSLQK